MIIRYVAAIVARSVVLAVTAALLAACGPASQVDRSGNRPVNDRRTEQESVRAAIASLEAAARNEDAPGVCRLLFSSEFLSTAIRRHPELSHLQLAPEAGAPLSRYDADQRSCSKQFGQGGEFAAFRDLPDVSSVRVRRVKPTRSVTAVATASATVSPGGDRVRLTLVEFRREWRYLFITS